MARRMVKTFEDVGGTFYEVVLSRPIEQRVVVGVHAESPEEAKAIALGNTRLANPRFGGWRVDQDSLGEITAQATEKNYNPKAGTN